MEEIKALLLLVFAIGLLYGSMQKKHKRGNKKIENTLH